MVIKTTVWVINNELGTIQIYTGWGIYTCPTETRDGELYFKFKSEWYKVEDYTSEHTSVF